MEGKLDGSDYTLWKFKIFMILDTNELLESVMGPFGADLEPLPKVDHNNPTIIIQSDVADLHAWESCNMVVLST